jgi:hypothetical protein
MGLDLYEKKYVRGKRVNKDQDKVFQEDLARIKENPGKRQALSEFMGALGKRAARLMSEEERKDRASKAAYAASSKMTEEERKERARKGGLASAKKRAEQKKSE